MSIELSAGRRTTRRGGALPFKARIVNQAGGADEDGDGDEETLAAARRGDVFQSSLIYDSCVIDARARDGS